MVDSPDIFKKKKEMKESLKCKDDQDSSEASSHIKNIDLYDRMNFQRIQFKRKSTKLKTTVCPKPKLTMEKFTEEIVKIVEELDLNNYNQSSKNVGRKRTIKFATQKVTFQYPKDKEVLKSVFSNESTSNSFATQEINEEDEKQCDEDTKNIFVFGDHHDDDEDKEHNNDENKQHIDINVIEEM